MGLPNSYIYLFTKRNPASKHIVQLPGPNYIPGAREEFISDILTSKPAIITIMTDEDGNWHPLHNWHTEILEMIEKEYKLISDEHHFHIFKRKENV